MWRMLRSRRVQFAVVVVSALLAVAMWPRALEVDAAPVTRGVLVVTVDDEGETRVREKFVITAPVGTLTTSAPRHTTMRTSAR